MGEEGKKGSDGDQGKKEVVEEKTPKAKEEKADKPSEEAKKDSANAGGGGGEGEKKDGATNGGDAEKGGEKAEPPPPPEELVMRVFMHCEGCARKVQRCLKGFPGVEEVKTDSKAHKVVVKGKKAAEDPMKVVERVQKKTGRKVELLTPLPAPAKKEEEKKPEEPPKAEEKKEPVVISVVIKVHMHCEACAQEIKKRILKMKGVQSVEADQKSSQVTVKGIFDPPKLVEYVHKRTCKQVVLVKTDQDDKKPESESDKAAGAAVKDAGDEKKSGDGDKAAAKDGEKAAAAGTESKNEAKNGGAQDNNASPEEAAAAAATAAAKVERMINDFYQQHHARHSVGYAYQYNSYPPQIFSDENPNACTLM